MSGQQHGGASRKYHCGKCNGLLTRQDRRPRTLKMRLKHPNSQLYICRECGARNLVKRAPSPAPQSSPTPIRSQQPSRSPAERYREIQQRIVRNKRAYVKLRAMIDSDKKLLERMSADH